MGSRALLPLLVAAPLLACRAEPRAPAAPPAPPADLILWGGPIVTMDPARPRVEAIALRGERVAALGRRGEVEALRGPRTRVVDLAGRAALPGLTDSHIHFARLGLAARTLFLDETKSADEVVAIIAERVRREPPGTWITGSGWHTSVWRTAAYPDRAALDRVAPDHPVYLAGMANHAAWVNSRALALAGVDRTTPDPRGGHIERDARGEATGVLLEDAKELVKAHLPATSPARHLADVRASVDAALALGLTAVHDAGTSAEDLAAYRALDAEGALRVRVYALMYVAGPGRELDAILARPPQVAHGGGRLTVRAIKAYADGALGARGARLLAPYADAPGALGQWVNDPDALARLIHQAGAAGWQVGVHAIGDAGNRAVLDAVERANAELGPGDRRTRIEHAQVLDPADLARFAPLGVIAAMQPIHATMDMGFVAARLGPARLAGAYAWRSLLASGARVVASADTPAYPVRISSPLLGLHAAVTRQDEHGQPAGGFTPAERVTIDQALAMYTRDAAYAAFEERARGTLAVGKLADLTVVSIDPLTAEPARLLDAAIEMTIVAGRIEYARRPITGATPPAGPTGSRSGRRAGGR